MSLVLRHCDVDLGLFRSRTRKLSTECLIHLEKSQLLFTRSPSFGTKLVESARVNVKFATAVQPPVLGASRSRFMFEASKQRHSISLGVAPGHFDRLQRRESGLCVEFNFSK
ncbi:hypothetical protein TNIN_46241 [Trichonephila inaurata madagascariensis]|uniref:Uncharacterized protein n=1 Tax=Trichonephila inaurata madagascariensis TaxID=2747483 RepID=A0A8X6YQW8_9ARAC|nr:hypothetical protein TNIN_46241 [Trichonephila inaurata madagascariensis]